MEKNSKDYLVALLNVRKFQSRIVQDKSSFYSNRKKLAIYWMCTDICAQTQYFMNNGLDKLFNVLHKHGWINFSCTSAPTRYGFRFTPNSKISLTSSGRRELLNLKEATKVSD